LVARALEQRALRQHAEVLAARQHAEAEKVLVEVEPVGGAIAEDRLHDAEPVQPRHRRRPRVAAGERHEVDVVDREVAVAVDEVEAVDGERIGRLGQLFFHAHSGWIPACLTMRPHLSISALITALNSSGVPPWISMPAPPSLARTSSCLSAALIAPLSFATTG